MQTCVVLRHSFLELFPCRLADRPGFGGMQTPLPWLLKQLQNLRKVDLVVVLKKKHKKTSTNAEVVGNSVPIPTFYHSRFSPAEACDTSTLVCLAQRYLDGLLFPSWLAWEPLVNHGWNLSGMERSAGGWWRRVSLGTSVPCDVSCLKKHPSDIHSEHKQVKMEGDFCGGGGNHRFCHNTPILRCWWGFPFNRWLPVVASDVVMAHREGWVGLLGLYYEPTPPNIGTSKDMLGVAVKRINISRLCNGRWFRCLWNGSNIILVGETPR